MGGGGLKFKPGDSCKLPKKYLDPIESNIVVDDAAKKAFGKKASQSTAVVEESFAGGIRTFVTVEEEMAAIHGYVMDKRPISSFKEVGFKPINFDNIEHIFAPTASIKPNGRPTGMHHDWMGMMEQCGEHENRVFKLANVRKLQKECYSANVFYDGKWKKTPSSFFPKSMNRLEVVDSILEAIGNIVEGPVIKQKGWIQITGIAKNGIPIQILLDKGAKLVSVFPDISRLAPK